MNPNGTFIYKQMTNPRLGNNIVTIRSHDWLYNLPKIPASESYTEAKMKERRMYKRFCRLVF